ncbi:hypothetical protein EST38_g7834 [Candolleomyces aberdarensis]|uniref:Uncharacterized protein n=1 Tax=Candolleomyces aberdarensis TaxID=2316362 RepID=A0A4V1Q3B7_9AGAR|nr:hypothetical protein EST38_g7834 [Candolleomyces aberdarensis]
MPQRSNLQRIAEVLKRSKKAASRLQIAVARSLSVRVSILDLLPVPFTASLTSLVLSGISISQTRSLPSGLFPSLESLVLRIHQEEHEEQRTWLLERPIVAFESAPALRRVATSKLSFSESGAATLRLPWHQLTHLIEADYNEVSDRFLIKFLPQCVSLQWLHIVLLDDIGQHFGETWRNEPVRTMQKLQSLTLNFWGSCNGTSRYPVFLDNFKFPGLRSLRLEGSRMNFDDADAWDSNQVDRFIHKIEHEFHLEYLSISHSPTARPSLERLFKATPHVTTLDAQIYMNYENFFETLTIGGDSSQFILPRLKTLVLELGLSATVQDSEGFETINPDTFAVFLESRMRCAPGSRLRKIVLYGDYSDEISDEIAFVQVIQRYLPEGLLLERHIVGELRYGKLDDFWVERDPELQDWLEASAAM